MKTCKYAVAALSLLISGTASAEFITKDWQAVGDGLITLNTETGVEWLALTETVGYSINQASALTETGQALDGWHVAKKADVSTLINYLYPDVPWVGTSYRDQRRSHYGERNYLTEPFLQIANDWIQTTTGGGAWKADYSFLAYGLYADTDNVGWAGTGYSYAYDPQNKSYTTIVQAPYDVPSWDRNTTTPRTGVFLINDTSAPNGTSMSRTTSTTSDVHAPAALGAMLLVMVGASRRRRHLALHQG
jgi:MYXO-CTERM domain-containing protein